LRHHASRGEKATDAKQAFLLLEAVSPDGSIAPNLLERFTESQNRSICCLTQFRTENRFALFLELL
jgi:hypothetical protein